MPKRALFFCALLAVCAVLFCACASSQSASAPPASAPQAENEAGPQPLHMLHSSNRRASKDAFTSEGKYFFQLRSDEAGGLNLLYLDYASQSAIVLCEKPNCLHNDETCTSFFPLKYGSASSCVVKNYLYLIFSGSKTENVPPTLFRLSLNGQNRTEISTLPSEFSYSNPIATDGEKLYTICNRLEINDEGIGHTFSNLISIALENGAIETLRKWNSDAYLWGAENSEMFIMVPLNSEGSSLNFNVESINAAGELKNTESFCQMSSSYFVADNKLYWYEKENASLCCRKLNSSSCEVLVQDIALAENEKAFLSFVFYPYIFLEIGDFSNNHGKFYYRVFNLEEQTNYEVRLFLFETSTDNKLIRIIDLVNDSFIVNNRENYQEVIALNEDGQAVVFETWAPVQSFISVNDLLNSVPNYHEIELPQPA